MLSNLGLSYALTKQLPEAEAALREASASPRADARVRQNLALVLALEGKFAEAEADQPAGHDGAGGERQCRRDQADDRAERFLARSADRRREAEARQAATPLAAPGRAPIPAAAAPAARRLRSARRKARRSGRRGVALRARSA